VNPAEHALHVRIVACFAKRGSYPTQCNQERPMAVARHFRRIARPAAVGRRSGVCGQHESMLSEVSPLRSSSLCGRVLPSRPWRARYSKPADRATVSDRTYVEVGGDPDGASAGVPAIRNDTAARALRADTPREESPDA
jgi:hypothetical protein